NGAWSARSQHRIRTGYIRSLRPETKAGACSPGRIRIRVVAARPSEWIGQIGVVQNVEELSTELGSKMLFEIPGLGDRHVPVGEGRTPKNAWTRCAIASKRRRNQH